MGSARSVDMGSGEEGASDLRAHAHSLAGLSRIPEAVVWLAEGEMEDRRSPEAAELLGDLPLLAALRASSLARLRRAMESSRLQGEARRGVELVLRDGRALDATILADEDAVVVVLRDVSRYTAQIDELRADGGARSAHGPAQPPRVPRARQGRAGARRAQRATGSGRGGRRRPLRAAQRPARPDRPATPCWPPSPACCRRAGPAT